MVKDIVILTRHSRILTWTSVRRAFWGITGLNRESQLPLMGIVYLGQGWSFQVEDDLKTSIFWCFSSKSLRGSLVGS